MRKYLWFVLLIATASAQNPITLQELWALAQHQNYSLQISSLYRQQAATLSTRGNAGLMPLLSANGFTNNSVNNTRLGLANGDVIENNGANATSYGAGLNFDWNLYSFGANKFKLEQLKTQLNSSHIIYSRDENDLAADLSTAYFQLVLAGELLSLQDSNLTVGQLRTDLSKAKYESGRSSKTDWLQAQVDLNTDKSLRMEQQLAWEEAQLKLADLLGQRGYYAIKPATELLPDTTLELKTIMELSNSQNPDILLAKSEQTYSSLVLREVKSSKYPILNMNLGSTYLNSQNPASFVTQNRNIAFNYGLTATVNLWNGGNQRSKEKAADIQLKIEELEYRQKTTAVENAVWAAWTGYDNRIRQWQLELDNRSLAKENMDIALERYRLGRGSQLDLRAAQVSLLQAQQRELQARFQLKLYEIELRRLAGTLPGSLN